MELKNLLGLPIYDTNMGELLSVLLSFIKANQKKTIFGISAAAYGRLKYRKDLGRIYHEFDINIAEGGGIPLLAKIFGIKITEKIGLTNLTLNLISLAAKHNFKIQLFGSTDEVLSESEINIKKKHPNIKLAQSINGYFQDNEIDLIIDKVNKESPDILFIGITYPIKERFAIKYKDRLNVKLIVPCGGAFEVLACKVKRPPFELKYIPLAWLFRFFQEPRRLFKPIIVTTFYMIVWVFLILYFRHITHIERNPSILKFFGITGNEWDPKKDGIRN